MISDNLRELAKEEESNSNLKSSCFYNFMSEQIEMHNVKYEKRIYPNDSFTIACGLSLHNYSGTRYEKIRKSTPFLLLPDKRSLFTGLSTSNVPLDSFFSTKKHSAHSSILLKICEWLKDKLVVFDKNGAPHHPMIVMALHLDEVHIVARHSFSNKSLTLVWQIMMLKS